VGIGASPWLPKHARRGSGYNPRVAEASALGVACPIPRVAVVIPVYRSEATLERCLEALRRQSFRSFETVVLDSSPDDACETIVRGRFPEIDYRHARDRCLPQEARNLGAARGRAPLLVFTDPDVYPAADWLERLVAAHEATGGVVVGALACHGERWLDRGIHLCKFSKWLPGGPARAVDMSPTANMLIPRRLFEEAGGLPGELFQGDTTLSWELSRRGHTLWLEPRAVVDHHHLTGFRAFLAERFRRGREFAGLRMAWTEGGRWAHLAFLLASALPVRLASNLVLALDHSRRSGSLHRYGPALPVAAAGFAASLAGEAASYARGLVAPRTTGSAVRRSAVSS
jgi:GT2 family glycosyltransferase